MIPLSRSSSSIILSLSSTAVRWAGRVLTAAILAFWLYFIVAHLFGDEGQASAPLRSRDFVSLASMLTSLLGLALALLRPQTGASLTLAAAAVGAIANWKTLLFPVCLIPLTAAHILCGVFLRAAASKRVHLAKPG